MSSLSDTAWTLVICFATLTLHHIFWPGDDNISALILFFAVLACVKLDRML